MHTWHSNNRVFSEKVKLHTFSEKTRLLECHVCMPGTSYINNPVPLYSMLLATGDVFQVVHNMELYILGMNLEICFQDLWMWPLLIPPSKVLTTSINIRLGTWLMRYFSVCLQAIITTVAFCWIIVASDDRIILRGMWRCTHPLL